MQARTVRAQERGLEKDLVGQAEKALTFLGKNKGSREGYRGTRGKSVLQCLGLSCLQNVGQGVSQALSRAGGSGSQKQSSAQPRGAQLASHSPAQTSSELEHRPPNARPLPEERRRRGTDTAGAGLGVPTLQPCPAPPAREEQAVTEAAAAGTAPGP